MYPDDSLAPEEQQSSLLRLHQSIRVKILENGPRDMQVANFFCIIGDNYSRSGKMLEALSMFEKDLQICLHSLDQSNIRIATAKYNVGLAHCKAGSFPAAVPVLEDALRIRLGRLGPQHILVADTLTCLGGAYFHTERHAEALDAFQRVVSIRQAVSARDPVNVLKLALSLRNSASAHASLGQNDRAVAECGEAHAVMVALLGSAHPLAEATRRMLAVFEAGSARDPAAPQVGARLDRQCLSPSLSYCLQNLHPPPPLSLCASPAQVRPRPSAASPRLPTSDLAHVLSMKPPPRPRAGPSLTPCRRGPARRATGSRPSLRHGRRPEH
jgi:tetratricopeptide (TPR) repeat protein